MLKKVFNEARYLYYRLRSPSLNLDEFKIILGDELKKEFGKEIKLREEEIVLGFYLDNNGLLFAALSYNFDGFIWLVSFDKKVRKTTFRWINDHRQGMYYQNKLKGMQTLSYGESRKILFQERRSNKSFLALN